MCRKPFISALSTIFCSYRFNGIPTMSIFLRFFFLRGIQLESHSLIFRKVIVIFSASSSNCPALHSRNLHLSSLNSISCFSEQKKDTNIAVFHHPCQPDLYICFYKVNCRIIPIFFINSVIVSIKV